MRTSSLLVSLVDVETPVAVVIASPGFVVTGGLVGGGTNGGSSSLSSTNYKIKIPPPSDKRYQKVLT